MGGLESSMTSRGRQTVLQWSLLFGLVFITYFLAGGVGQQLALIPGVTITFWPPLGVFLASLLLSDRRRWGLVVLAAGLAELACNEVWFHGPSHNPLYWALAYFAGNALEALVAAWLIRRVVRGPFRLETLDEVAVFVVVGGALAPMLGATVIAGIDAIREKHTFREAWPLVWLGDAAGVLMLTPLLVVVVHTWRERGVITRARLLEGCGVAALLGLAATLAFTDRAITPYVVMPPLLWAAARFQLRGAGAALGLICLMGVFMTRSLAGAAQDPAHTRAEVLAVQAFFVIAAASALVVAAASLQRQQALRDLQRVNADLEARVAERTLNVRKSHESLAELVERCPFGIYIVDQDFRVAMVNEGSQRGAFANVRPLIGRPFEEVMRILWPEPVASEVIVIFRRVLESGEPYRSLDFVSPRSDVDRIEGYEWEVHRIVMPDGRFGAVCYYFDATKLREAERALRESEERFRRMADDAPVMVWVTEPDGRCSFLSRSWYEFTGQTPEAGLGFGWLDAVHPDDRQLAEAAFVRANELRQSFRLEYRLRRASDGEYRWAIDAAAPRSGPDGTFLGYIGSVIDIGERKAAEEELRRHREELEHIVDQRTRELEASNERVRLSERMASLGTLAAGLGHDMGNLLIPMRVRLDALESLALPGDARAELDGLKASTTYLAKLTSGLRLLATDTASIDRQPTELHAFWAEAETVLRNAVRRRVVLEASFPDGALYAAIAGPALMQIVFNLVQNSGDALADDPNGRVVVSAEAVDDAFLRLRVSDNGPGMSEEVKRRCMEPFFTTKARGVSTGLGLSLVYALVRDAGGTIELESEAGRGCTCSITLRRPRAGAHDRPPRRAAVDIEDPRLRAYVSGELRSLNFDVIDARDGVDLLVCDKGDAEFAGKVIVVASRRASEVKAAIVAAALE